VDYNLTSIEAVFWIDDNGNGQLDEGEEPIAGETVELLDEEGNPVQCPDNEQQNRTTDADQPACVAITDPNGRYRFDNLPAGKYKLRFTLPDDKVEEGYVFVTDGAQQSNTITVDVDTAENPHQIVLAKAAVQCGCSGITGDAASSLSVAVMIVFSLMTLLLGSLPARRRSIR
jgi:hypothetical protein